MRFESSSGRAWKNRVADKPGYRLASLFALSMLCSLVWADDSSSDPRVAFDIPQQRADLALTEFAEQADLTLVFPSDVAREKLANSLIGEYTLEEGVRILLSGTGLNPAFSNRVVLSVATDEASAGEGDVMKTSKKAGLVAILIGMFAGGADAQEPAAAAQAAQTIEKTENVPLEIEEIIVTGTNIRGGKDQFSPVTSIGRDEIDLGAFNTVSDIFDRLPQNFGGGITPDSALTQGGSLNGPGNASVNLRGLGNEATLILLNGRRLAPGGGFGDSVDISSIPTTAIDRVEILTDGASAVYGSDAIAGVVNIILRDDFEGSETRLNLSTLTDGGGSKLSVGQTLGWDTDQTHGLITYEYSSEDELDRNDRNFSSEATNIADPTYLLPFNQKHSVFANIGFQVSPHIKFDADSYYNNRKTETFTSLGVESLGQNFSDNKVEQFGAAAELNIQVSDNWEGRISGSYSNSSQLSESIRIDLGDGTGAIVDATTEIVSVDATIGGTLFQITDEPVRGVLGGQFRHERADLLRTNRLTGSVAGIEADRTRDVFAIFSEVYAPVITATNEIWGINRFAVTFAGRYEDYTDVGSSFDPKVGAVWSPVSGLDFRGTYGTSFRAPRLEQLNDLISSVFLGVYADPLAPSGESIAITVTGDTSELAPEEAESWTVGFDFAPTFLSGFQVRATYFDIDYGGRVASAFSTFDSQFRFTGYQGIPTRSVNPGEVQALVDEAITFIDFFSIFPSLGTGTIDDVTVILDERPQNTSATNVSGVDVSLSYNLPTEFGDLSLFLNGTYLTAFEQQFSVLTDVDDLLDTFGNPADLRMRSGISWNTNPFTAAINVNYVDGYTDDQASTGSFAVDSWTTVDASLRLDLENIFDNEFASNALLVLTMSNAFNAEPPAIGPRTISAAIFDPANADPSGRRIGILVSKQF